MATSAQGRARAQRARAPKPRDTSRLATARHCHILLAVTAAVVPPPVPVTEEFSATRSGGLERDTDGDDGVRLRPRDGATEACRRISSTLTPSSPPLRRPRTHQQPRAHKPRHSLPRGPSRRRWRLASRARRAMSPHLAPPPRNRTMLTVEVEAARGGGGGGGGGGAGGLIGGHLSQAFRI
jgi:hypothetical protein